MLETYYTLVDIARNSYPDIVSDVKLIGKRTRGSSKLRIIFKDSSFLDIWLSSSSKYSYHWEQRAQRGIFYRHDNAPDHPEVYTYPKHLHNGNEPSIQPSDISDNPEIALVYLLNMIREALSKTK
jgi:hypothetical protein